MNKQMKQSLEAVVTALVEQNTDAATEAFHTYLRLKSQAILVGEAADPEEDEDEDKDDDKKSDDKKSDEDEGDEDEGDEEDAKKKTK